jgi:hypothetical protein
VEPALLLGRLPGRGRMALVSEGQWERGFQLSYFVLLDRATARECVARAIEKLAAQRTREKRRTYWRGRKKELTIRRISRPAEDTLQWLICLESEACEKEQESQGRPTEADMVVRYVKHLAQMTTVSSSFHVNVGFNRLLRNYSTPEVQQVYELATERYPAPEEYRKAKGKLLNQLAERFERFVRIRKAQYGELQFETHEAQQGWSPLVEECLEIFSPWSSHQGCFQDAASGPPGRAGGGPDRLETNRCHWFMHSTCYGRLVNQLGFDPPRERLSVPRFLHHDGGDPGSSPNSLQRRTGPLSDDDTRMLRERVSSVDRDDAIAPVPLRIVAHGAVRATLDPSRDERRRFEIEAGTQLLEVRSNEAEGDRILATHWIDYGEDHRILAGEYTLRLQRGRQLAFSVAPVDGGSRAVVMVEACSASTVRAGLFNFQGGLWSAGGLLRPVLASVVLVAVGGLVASAWFAPRISQDRAVIGHMADEVAAQKATIATLQQMPKDVIPSIARYAFSAETSNLRAPGDLGSGNGGEPVVSFAPGQSLVILELPVDNDEHGPFRVTLSTFPEQQERLSEMALQPVKRGSHRVVEFPLPAALVEGNGHYLLDLTHSGGGAADARRYVFEVRK